MATVKALTMRAREYFYSDNFLDLEDVMLSLEEKSPSAASRLRTEFADCINEQIELDSIGDIAP